MNPLSRIALTPTQIETYVPGRTPLCRIPLPNGRASSYSAHVAGGRSRRFRPLSRSLRLRRPSRPSAPSPPPPRTAREWVKHFPCHRSHASEQSNEIFLGLFIFRSMQGLCRYAYVSFWLSQPRWKYEAKFLGYSPVVGLGTLTWYLFSQSCRLQLDVLQLQLNWITWTEGFS